MDLTEIIDRFRGPLIGLIVSWGAKYDDALEIAQDSFADAYLNREACRGDWKEPEVFGAWLRGIARNKFRNDYRRRKRRERLMVAESTPILASEQAPIPKEDERLERLREAIERLPWKLKQVVMMHYLETTSVKEVAFLLSVTPRTVEGRLYQARRHLKRLMGESMQSNFPKTLLL